MWIVGNYQHMFGWNTVHTKETIAIALGEFDALAVTEATNIPCLSSPNGDSSLVKVIKRDFRAFENYNKIVFIPDKDKDTDNPNVVQPSQAVAEAAKLLGLERCWIATPSLDDPNEYVMQNKSTLLKQLFWSAVPASQELWYESSRELIQPIAFGRMTGWAEFDKRIQGLRMCETTYILGQPGAGKTTFLCWLMWLMTQRAINMAALILEGSVRQFVTKLSHTFYGGNIFTASDAEVDEIAKQIDKHIHFARQPEKIEMAIRTAVVQHDVEVVVIDNITAISNPEEVFASTSQLVTLFDKLAAELCIHIIILSHVKIDAYGEKAGIGSAAGSREIGAKAYNMLALHARKEVGLIKCRERGDAEGWWPLVYDPNSARYIEGVRALEFSE